MLRSRSLQNNFAVVAVSYLCCNSVTHKFYYHENFKTEPQHFLLHGC